METTAADLYDLNPDSAEVCNLQFRSFGKRRRFSGQCAVVRTFEDHLPVLEMLKGEGNGRVLVVDGGGSLRVGVLGDRIAGIAVASGWTGVILFGAIRDSVAIDQLDFGVKALGATARRGWEKPRPLQSAPVTFGDVRFEPGDWIYADEDSVILSRRQLAFDAARLPNEEGK